MLFLLNISFFEALFAVLASLIGSNEDTARAKLHTSLLVQGLGDAGDLAIEGGLPTPNLYDLAGHDAPAPWARRLQGTLSKLAARARSHVFIRTLDVLPGAGRFPGGEWSITWGGDSTLFVDVPSESM